MHQTVEWPHPPQNPTHPIHATHQAVNQSHLVLDFFLVLYFSWLDSFIVKCFLFAYTVSPSPLSHCLAWAWYKAVCIHWSALLTLGLVVGQENEAPWQLPTCEHAFVHHTAPINQNSITRQWAFSWENEDISRDQEAGFQLLHTYTTAEFPWLADLLLFSLKNERDCKLTSACWQELPWVLTCASPSPLNHKFPGTRTRELIPGP